MVSCARSLMLMPGLMPGMMPGRVVALAVIAHHAAQQRVHRQAERLAADIPQRQVERAEGVFFLAPGRIEEGARHVLPEALDVLRVLADQAAGALFEHLLGAAFADAGDAGVGLDGHHQVALIEERIRLGRRVDAHPVILVLGDCGKRARRIDGGGGRCRRERTKKGSAMHEGYSIMRLRGPMRATAIADASPFQVCAVPVAQDWRPRRKWSGKNRARPGAASRAWRSRHTSG